MTAFAMAALAGVSAAQGPVAPAAADLELESGRIRKRREIVADLTPASTSSAQNAVMAKLHVSNFAWT